MATINEIHVVDDAVADFARRHDMEADFILDAVDDGLDWFSSYSNDDKEVELYFTQEGEVHVNIEGEEGLVDTWTFWMTDNVADNVCDWLEGEFS